ncbi:NAD(P)/FAD-dependent oxidoreductase [Brevibacterium gallinarum]|uniref:FAD-binding oxidoreductase n=1 Tax=Brevibacterium gallinarum TaxID=2762220 RepID=A0ABR8WYP5_9MICO|nr:FAD-dependent oxidoreductase [Brevibacterium gallinarum]MBD8021806.1 FAD-binding oxidoreductase [Brevibacterium gallinarum]
MTRVLIVGAGIIGLATAYQLAQRGAEVTVLDRSGVAAGASWGNAGWVCPGLATPLAAPGGWRHGIDAVTKPHAPLTFSRITPALTVFLAKFAAQMTERRFHAALRDNAGLARQALPAFDRLADAGVTSPVHRADFTIGAEDNDTIVDFDAELDQIAELGIDVGSYRIDPATVPFFSNRITAALCVTGQAYIDPGEYCQALAGLAEQTGVQIVTDAEVVAGHAGTDSVSVVDRTGRAFTADELVVAAGAWSDGVLRAICGRRAATGQASGRGYSFTVDADPAHLPEGPVYLPARRVVLTPYQDAIRVAGTMEFADPDAPLRPGRIEAIVAQISPLLHGIDLADTRDHWVGPRPVSTDGRPVTRRIGDRVTAATGHGMWGVVFGPVTGEIVAEQLLGS